jgi:vanillate O-demethylase ferredoxin subunit
MIDAVSEAAKKLGWSPNRIHSEVFSAAQTNAEDHAFTVELRRSGKTVQVGADTTILDALIAAGYPALYDCRRGECGLCPLKVLAAPNGIDHRDRYLDEEERDSGKTLCVCVSRVRGDSLVLDA